MVFLRQAEKSSPQEIVTFSYWLTVLQLLKIGIAGEAILSFTEGEVAFILGIQGALDQREADEQTREMAKNAGNIPMSKMGM